MIIRTPRVRRRAQFFLAGRSVESAEAAFAFATSLLLLL
jgi:hypothetical protein